jgi:uncharacterized protein YbjT (DUF2867 family)
VILVTGATGFVGKAVVQRLLTEDDSLRIKVAVRRDSQQWNKRVVPCLVSIRPVLQLPTIS